MRILILLVNLLLLKNAIIAQVVTPDGYGLKEFSIIDKKLGLIQFYVDTVKSIKIEKDLMMSILDIDVSAENQYVLKGDKMFFRYLLAVERKRLGYNTMPTKRLFVRLNNGSLSLSAFVASLKDELKAIYTS